MLLSGADVDAGEVFGSCVFDLLAILGVVCVRMPLPASPTTDIPQLAAAHDLFLVGPLCDAIDAASSRWT